MSTGFIHCTVFAIWTTADFVRWNSCFVQGQRKNSSTLVFSPFHPTFACQILGDCLCTTDALHISNSIRYFWASVNKHTNTKNYRQLMTIIKSNNQLPWWIIECKSVILSPSGPRDTPRSGTTFAKLKHEPPILLRLQTLTCFNQQAMPVSISNATTSQRMQAIMTHHAQTNKSIVNSCWFWGHTRAPDASGDFWHRLLALRGTTRYIQVHQWELTRATRWFLMTGWWF